MSFSVGDIVWAKLPGYPYWPAQIINPKYASRAVQKQCQVGQNALLRFYGTRDLYLETMLLAVFLLPISNLYFISAWVDRYKDLEPWMTENKQKHETAGAKSRSHVKFAVALREVEEKLDFNNSEAPSSIKEAAAVKPATKRGRKRKLDDNSDILSPSANFSQASSMVDEDSFLSPRLPATQNKAKSQPGALEDKKLPFVTKKARKEEFAVPSQLLGDDQVAIQSLVPLPNPSQPQEKEPKSPFSSIDPAISQPLSLGMSKLDQSVLAQTPLKQVEKSPVTPISPIIPQSWGSIGFPTPNAFPPTQVYRSPSCLPTQIYNTQECAPTQLYKSPGVTSASQAVPLQGPVSDSPLMMLNIPGAEKLVVERPAKRLVYDDVLEMLDDNFKDAEEKHSPVKVKEVNPTAKRKRGRQKASAPEEMSVEAKRSTLAMLDEKLGVENAVQLGRQPSVVQSVDNSVPLFDEPSSPILLKDTTNDKNPTPRMTSPLISKSKPRIRTESTLDDKRAPDSPLKLQPKSQAPFEIAKPPDVEKVAPLDSMASQMVTFMSEFKAMKEKVEKLEAEHKLFQEEKAKIDVSLAELVSLASKQGAQHKALKKELKDALRDQKEQVQRILKDQKNYLESSVEAHTGAVNDIGARLTKIETQTKSALDGLGNRLNAAEKESTTIVAHILDSADALRNKIKAQVAPSQRS